MTEEKQVKIEERARTYDIKLEYHSDLMCENYDAEILAIQESDNRVTFSPKDKYDDSFTFKHSDPDRVIAIAKMMQAFAELAKKDNKKAIDISSTK